MLQSFSTHPISILNLNHFSCDCLEIQTAHFRKKNEVETKRMTTEGWILMENVASSSDKVPTL